jgi:hypothetical protein
MAAQSSHGTPDVIAAAAAALSASAGEVSFFFFFFFFFSLFFFSFSFSLSSSSSSFSSSSSSSSFSSSSFSSSSSSSSFFFFSEALSYFHCSLDHVMPGCFAQRRRCTGCGYGALTNSARARNRSGRCRGGGLRCASPLDGGDAAASGSCSCHSVCHRFPHKHRANTPPDGATAAARSDHHSVRGRPLHRHAVQLPAQGGLLLAVPRRLHAARCSLSIHLIPRSIPCVLWPVHSIRRMLPIDLMDGVHCFCSVLCSVILCLRVCFR